MRDGLRSGVSVDDDEPVFLPLGAAPTVADSLPRTFVLVLSQGRVVCVPVGFDGATLRQLRVVLEEAPSC